MNLLHYCETAVCNLQLTRKRVKVGRLIYAGKDGRGYLRKGRGVANKSSIGVVVYTSNSYVHLVYLFWHRLIDNLR